MKNKVVRVKICGICDWEIAHQAVEAGVDALGFVFAPSKRRISPEKAKQVCRKLPPFVSRVGVFVNPTLDEVKDIAVYVGLDTIQLHGDETPKFCNDLNYKVIKSLSVVDGNIPYISPEYRVDAFLLDTGIPGSFGGTGVAFDWQQASNFQAGPLILAGGLNPENVQDAIEIAKPYAVDVSSGVETNGDKDALKIRDFIRRVKG